MWSGQSGWRFGREMSLNVRLHNMVCFPVPIGCPRLENRVQMFYITKEPKYTLNVVYGWRSCFFSKRVNQMGKTVMMSVITGNTRIEFGQEEMSLGLKCGESWGQNVNLKKRLCTVKVHCSYFHSWQLSLDEKMHSGRAVISFSTLEVLQRHHHWDLSIWLWNTTTSFLRFDQPHYCAVHFFVLQ